MVGVGAGGVQRDKPLVSEGALCRRRGGNGRLGGLDEHACFLRRVLSENNNGLVRCRREVNAHRKVFYFVFVHARSSTVKLSFNGCWQHSCL